MEGVGLQAMEQALQEALAPDTYDLDISSARFTIAAPIINNTWSYLTPMPGAKVWISLVN